MNNLRELIKMKRLYFDGGTGTVLQSMGLPAGTPPERWNIDHPEKIPSPYDVIGDNEGVARAVCDFISSMTDRYAIDLYTSLFVPAVWKGR